MDKATKINGMTIEVISKKLKNNYYNFESKISIHFESCL